MKTFRIVLMALFVVAGLAYLNVIIPRPQGAEARTYNDDKGFQAQEFPCNQGNCSSSAKVLKIAVHETPECTSGTLSSLSGYKGAAWFQNESSDTYKYHVVWGSYFCSNATTGSCTSGQMLGSTDFTLTPGGTTQTYSPARNESNLTCGKIQTDMSFQAWKKVGSDWVLALSYGSLSTPGTNNATYTYCTTGKACPTPTHKECQNNACTVVTGSGTDTCSSNSDCQPQTHKQCQDNACKVVSGPGADTCSTDSQCQTTQTHKECQNNACTVVNGAGNDTCSTDSQCQTTQHHMACVSNACQQVTGAGSDSCTQDSDCTTPHHMACVSSACTLVAGSGDNSCTQDSDCSTTCSGDNCGTTINITNNNSQSQSQQQQQQQAVLGASVAPASSATSLPSTGAGSEMLFGLLGLLPIGFKLRKFV